MSITHDDLSIIHLVMQASLLVKLVMGLLAVLSLVSWYRIFCKWFQINSAQSKADRFERDFWSGGDLDLMYQAAAGGRFRSGGMERIFEAGYREFNKLRNGKSQDHAATIDGSRRAMRATYQREVDDLDSHLSFLASVGSVSPYIGLLGTVWGIMNAFRGLASGVSAATMTDVAPGIAEALIATAIGLFAAIPAVVAYNRFAHNIDRLGIRFESFMEEFSNILQRNLR